MDKVRTVRFAPYRRGMGPTFTLQLFDGERHDEAGRWAICYRLVSNGQTIFECLDAHTAAYAHCAVDSDDAVKSVMGWLTLRPGDTDEDYFAGYTPDQISFCESHAEMLSCEVMTRFGEC
jgi:hypothetical protein